MAAIAAGRNLRFKLLALQNGMINPGALVLCATPSGCLVPAAEGGMCMSNVIFRAAVPVLCTEDVAASMQYLEHILGFVEQFRWGDPPVYAGVKAGDALLYVCHDPAMARAIREHELGPDVFLWVEGVDALYAMHRTRGADIVEALEDRPWGARQYVVREPNGYRLKIAQQLNDEVGGCGTPAGA
jgi:uncharacterized glyoxalase superfamily protein PhnB